MTHRAEDCNKEYTCTLFTHLLPHAPLSLPALLRDAQVSKRPSNVRCTKTHARLPAIMRANANVDSAGVTLPAPSPTPLPWYIRRLLAFLSATPGCSGIGTPKQREMHKNTCTPPSNLAGQRKCRFGRCHIACAVTYPVHPWSTMVLA